MHLYYSPYKILTCTWCFVMRKRNKSLRSMIKEKQSMFAQLRWGEVVGYLYSQEAGRSAESLLSYLRSKNLNYMILYL